MGLLNLLTMSAGVVAGTQIGLRYTSLKEPRPFPHQLAALLDHPVRQKFRDPVEAMAPFGIAPGSTVLDLGCGTGTFTVEMARQVGPQGTVHAVDIQSEMLDQARNRVGAAGLEGRVRFHHSGAYRLPLESESIDIAILIATLAEIPNRLLALEELRRVIRPGGRLAISEELPHPSYVPAPLVQRWLREAGFRYGGQQGTPIFYSLLYFSE
jgi:ubiquinone/menaquinone biosynthesis C-methylase UbiE